MQIPARPIRHRTRTDAPTHSSRRVGMGRSVLTVLFAISSPLPGLAELVDLPRAHPVPAVGADDNTQLLNAASTESRRRRFRLASCRPVGVTVRAPGLSDSGLVL